MNIDVARELTPIVKNSKLMSALKELAEERILMTFKRMEHEKDPVEIYKLQGRIAELRYQQGLKEAVEATIEDAKNG